MFKPWFTYILHMPALQAPTSELAACQIPTAYAEAYNSKCPKMMGDKRHSGWEG